MKKLVPFLIVAIALSPVHATWKKKVTRGGKTTVTGDAETMEQVKKDEEAKAAYHKELAEAPRRAPTDPIHVALLTPVWDGKEKNENQVRADQMLLDEFKNDPILRVTMVQIPRRSGKDQASLDILIAEAAGKGKSAEVYIDTLLGTEAALGHTRDGKAAVGNAIVYKAEVRSAYEPEIKNAKELGNLLQTVQMVKNIGRKVSDIIKNDIGPGLPDPKVVNEINKKYLRSGFQSATGIEAGDDAKTMMRKIFHRRDGK